jgi:hypothetical protein
VITREVLYRLIDELPDEELEAAREVLLELRARAESPLPDVLANAPLDDEAESDEERAAVAEAEEDFQQGRVVSHEEARRRLFGTT